MQQHRGSPPAPTERQLALPLEVLAALPIVVGPGPLRPRRVWGSLSVVDKLSVRHAVLRVCQEVVHDAHFDN
jgi:anthranilate/para-aminobenzoate synthase component II